MSNKVFNSYYDFPINPGLLYIKCCVCGLQYNDSNYAKEIANGDPSYYIEKNNTHTHFCGAKCALTYSNTIEQF